MEQVISHQQIDLIAAKNNLISKLRGTFFQIPFEAKTYCIKLLHINDILFWTPRLESKVFYTTPEDRKIGIGHFFGKEVPIIDCCSNNIQSLINSSGSGFCILTECMSRGMIQQLGFLVNSLEEFQILSMEEFQIDSGLH